MTDKAPEYVIHCPKCNSTNWYCWDERTRDCWNKDGSRAYTKVIGGLGCKDCGNTWLDEGPTDDAPDDCECEEWNR